MLHELSSLTFSSTVPCVRVSVCFHRTCHTTRGPYFGEENGIDYHYVSEEDFQNMIHMVSKLPIKLFWTLVVTTWEQSTCFKIILSSEHKINVYNICAQFIDCVNRFIFS